MSALPAVRAPAGSGPVLGVARALWPLASARWGLPGPVPEGVGPALAGAPPLAGDAGRRAIWPQGEPFAPPVVVVGLAWAGVLARAIGERSGTMQYRPRVLVVEPRAEHALAGLARLGEGPARAVLDVPGVEWFVGPGAMQGLEGWLAQRVDDPLPRGVLHNGAPAEAAAGVAGLLGEAHTRQQALVRERAATLRQWANSRPKCEAVRAKWRRGAGLRLLVITTRYSTYMRHAAADLVLALRGVGHEAELALEPDDHTRQTQLHYTRAVTGFDPDGVVLLNYFRPQIGPVLPPHVPVVTWSQDAMGHYFAGANPPRTGPLDFVAGMLYPELRDRLGVPEGRMLAWPNAVSPAKFHRGPAGDAFGHLRCDVAMMTRHSEPPERYVATRVAENRANAPVARAIGALEARVPAALERAGREHRWLVHELRAECQAALGEGVGRPASAGAVEGLLWQVAFPLAELHFRQEAARWAARVCERNGWRLHLYGKGWDDHPDLAAHARGELAHGEALRAAYQLAGVSIHASVAGLMHQRVAEAAMSGGLPIVRRSFEDVDRARWFQLNELAIDGGDASAEFVIADHPGLMRVAALWGRCGLTLGRDGKVSLSASEVDLLTRCPLGKPKRPADDPRTMLVDVSEVGFANEDELERIVCKAQDAAWRERWSAAIDPGVRERFAMDRFARAMVGLVRQSFV